MLMWTIMSMYTELRSVKHRSLMSDILEWFPYIGWHHFTRWRQYTVWQTCSLLHLIIRDSTSLSIMKVSSEKLQDTSYYSDMFLLMNSHHNHHDTNKYTTVIYFIVSLLVTSCFNLEWPTLWVKQTASYLLSQSLNHVLFWNFLAHLMNLHQNSDKIIHLS